MYTNVFQGQITQKFAVHRSQQKSVRTSQVCKAADGKIGTWLPGSEHPKYLDGSLPGDYGFDPLNLATNPADLQRYRVAELINGRWAMLGAAGAMVQEATGQGNWFDAPKWVFTGQSPTYLGITVPLSLPALAGIEAVAIAFVEMQRVFETDPQKSAYPGGSFDPLGFSKNPQTFRKFQVNEVKNARLAMIACVGFAFQHAVYNNGIFDNLKDHIADPTGKNFATNGISLPQFT